MLLLYKNNDHLIRTFMNKNYYTCRDFARNVFFLGLFFSWDYFSLGIVFFLGLFFFWDYFSLGNVFHLGLFFTWDCFSLGIVFDQECFFLGLFFPGNVFAGNVFTGIVFAWDCYFGIEKDGNKTAGMMCPDTNDSASAGS